MSVGLRLRDYGESGVLVGVEGDDYETRWSTTQVLAAALRDSRASWLVDLVATYDHLYVSFEPAQVSHREVEAEIEQLYVGLGTTRGEAGRSLGGRTFEVPVLFGGEAGPDLEVVAAELELTPDALVERLTSSPWRVRFVAAPVGSPFTDRPDWTAAIPRMGVPRVAVPSGSVALSGAQSIIYPVRSPGGWRLVGRKTRSGSSRGTRSPPRAGVPSDSCPTAPATCSATSLSTRPATPSCTPRTPRRTRADEVAGTHEALPSGPPAAEPDRGVGRVGGRAGPRPPRAR